MNAPTLLLLGDSILDNAAYTHPAPDTAEHLRRLLGPEWSVRHLAQDGATMAGVYSQLGALDGRAAVAVLSVGGNDALEHAGLLEKRVETAAEVLAELFAIGERFGQEYEAVARAVAEHAERTLLCTIYEVDLSPAPLAQLAKAPLSMLNDRIVRTAARLSLDVLDLRTVCNQPGDFALQIEPSAQGAEKIAQAIAAVVRDQPTVRSGRVFAA